MKPKTLILKTAGINCDEELAHGFRMAGADAEIVHINELVRGERSISEFDIIGFPGGFSYGDDLSAGRVLATEVDAHLLSELHDFYDSGKLMIGICNGFQTLVKAGILPYLNETDTGFETVPDATLFWNDSGKFEDRWVTLRVESVTKCVWTKGLPALIEYPVAHAEGKFIPSSDTVLQSLVRSGQIVFRYCDPANPDRAMTGEVPYPFNPNGSVGNIAGVCDPTGRVLGLMPHPERFLYAENHPRCTRRRTDASTGRLDIATEPERVDGLPLFKNAVEYILANKRLPV